ncbi:MAG: hypothetical protein IKH77_00820 [Clostridia bacterium]|nr:hypothetical protein [Clostridia bacterium]
MEKKKGIGILVVAIVAVLVIIGVVLWFETHQGNRQLVDTKYRFDYAIIALPNGTSVEGKVTSWYDYDDSDVVQVVMDGKTYLTHYSNVCLIGN